MHTNLRLDSLDSGMCRIPEAATRAAEDLSLDDLTESNESGQYTCILTSYHTSRAQIREPESELQNVLRTAFSGIGGRSSSRSL